MAWRWSCLPRDPEGDIPVCVPWERTADISLTIVLHKHNFSLLSYTLWTVLPTQEPSKKHATLCPWRQPCNPWSQLWTLKQPCYLIVAPLAVVEGQSCLPTDLFTAYQYFSRVPGWATAVCTPDDRPVICRHWKERLSQCYPYWPRFLKQSHPSRDQTESTPTWDLGNTSINNILNCELNSSHMTYLQMVCLGPWRQYHQTRNPREEILCSFKYTNTNAGLHRS